jgi:2-methylcitrate dehydratase PrpD
VLEGTHGLFNAFAHTREGNYGALLDGFGERWAAATLAFKPYPCGTMIQPYVDCARRLARRGIRARDVVELVCEVAEGTVHRLWEPLALKQHPPNGYAAKFSAPWCIAAALVRGNVGSDTFAADAVQDPAVRALAEKVRYEIDPANPYPNEFTGAVRVRLEGGSAVEERQPHLRGGAKEPLGRADLEDKLRANARAGGWADDRIEAALALVRTLWDGAVDLRALRG